VAPAQATVTSCRYSEQPADFVPPAAVPPPMTNQRGIATKIAQRNKGRCALCSLQAAGERTNDCDQDARSDEA